MKDLNIAIIQTEIYWEQIDKNLEMLESKIQAILSPVDLIILPETFTTGFAMKNVAQHAEPMDGKTIKWMRSISAHTGSVICGSIIISESELYYNRLLWVEPNGNIEHYDKRHLFRLAYEQNYFTAGSTQKIVELHGWKISLNICYDLRFPVWCRNQNLAYDVLLVTANWPEPRVIHWNTLVRARAIENLSYVLACNRVGLDGTGMNHTGDSAVVAADGSVMVNSIKEKVLYTTLRYSDLDRTRKRFAFYKDADEFKIL